MLKTETREIDGIQITVQQLPARRGFALMGRLGEIIAPALSKAEGLDMQADVSALLPVLGVAFGQLDSKTLDSIMVELFSTATAIVEGKQIPLNRGEFIDQVFSGKLKALFSALKFAVEVNYADFFADALAQINSAGANPKENG